PGFKTYTQGGWGAAPSGNNVGTFLNNNFAANFPAPTFLTIGCTNKLQLTSASAVRAFLPNGTTPFVLPVGTRLNPTKNNFSNVFAGQLVALALNLRFDNNIASFAPSTTNLKDLIIANGPFIGKTVQFLFDEANKRIGGCAAFNATLSQYTTAIDNVNRNYDNGVNSGAFLVCPLTAVCSASPALCYGSSTGSMTVTTNGGLAPFTYVWSGGVAGNTATATGLAAGTYTVTVTDASLQTATATCTVSQPTQVVAAAVVNGAILCNGGTTTVTVSATGGTGPYNGTGTFTVGAGTYTYNVTDANGCPASVSVSVTEPEPLAVSLLVDQRIRCNNDCNGVIISTVTGGTGAYSYLWSNGSTNAFVAGVCSGSYDVTVTDENGCEVVSEMVELDNPEVLALSALLAINDDNCGDAICNGSAAVEVSGGESPYTYVWTGGESDSNELTGLCEGAVVTVTVTDARGCEVSAEDAIINCDEEDCGPHKTFTQGGWGAEPNGNNPGVYLHANFDAAYPSGLTIGCGDNTLSFY
ncbi:MAG: SprB repeat-containing protein, partial [Flavobacteriales bacterium]